MVVLVFFRAFIFTLTFEPPLAAQFSCGSVIIRTSWMSRRAFGTPPRTKPGFPAAHPCTRSAACASLRIFARRHLPFPHTEAIIAIAQDEVSRGFIAGVEMLMARLTVRHQRSPF